MPDNRRGKAKLPEYGPWADMLQRCNNSNRPNYVDYGGRGITVCAAWRDFDVFFRDMGPRPPNTSLGRINNNEGYCPSNCRWESSEQQNYNKRSNRLLTYKSRTLPATQWAKEIGISPITLLTRIYRGWSVEDVLSFTTFKRGGYRPPAVGKGVR